MAIVKNSPRVSAAISKWKAPSRKSEHLRGCGKGGMGLKRGGVEDLSSGDMGSGRKSKGTERCYNTSVQQHCAVWRSHTT